MLLNQTSMPLALTKLLRSIGLCSQYLRYKVAMCIAIRHAKRQALTALWQAFNCLRLLAGWVLTSWALIICALTSYALAGLLLYANTSLAAEKVLQQKPVAPAAMPMDLIELLGELGDDEADLDAAMSSVESNQAAKKLPQTEPKTKPIATENSNTGAKK